MRDRGNGPRPRRLVVTGGIGSGKTTVARLFGELGATVIDADRIGHEILAPGGPCFEAVAESWPAVVEGGVIDRRRLAAIVFADPEQLILLERITHPVIAARIAEAVGAAGDEDIVVELPLSVDLIEPDWVLILVTAGNDVRLARVVERGMDREDVGRRMAVQAARGDPGCVDVVIRNDGDLAALRARVSEVWQQLA